MKKPALVAAAALTLGFAVACGDDTTETTTQSTSTGANGSTAASGGAAGSTSTQAGGNGGAGTGGGSGEACNACAQMQFDGPGSMCWDEFSPCLADTTCAAWFNCSQSCQGNDFDEACFDACNAQAAAAQSLYQPVLDCLCMACAAPCAPACN